MTPEQRAALAAADMALTAGNAALSALAEAVRVLRASLADPVPPPPAEPPPPPPNLVEAQGNAHYQQHREQPTDRIDTARMPAPMPWGIFADPATKLIARPANGASIPLDGYETLHVYGHMSGATWTVPAIIGGKAVQLYPSLGDDPVLNILPGLKSGKFPLRSGPRGVGTLTPYCTWHGHGIEQKDAAGNPIPGSATTNPHVPMWVGITVDGRICYAMRDGAVQYVYQVPLASYSFDFTYFDPDRSAQFVVDTGAGRVLKVAHSPTVPQTFSTEVFADGFGQATSIRAIGHLLYIADSTGNAVWEMDARTKERRKVCDMPRPWWLDSTSDGKLMVMSLDCTLREVDPSTGSIGPSLIPGTPMRGLQTWVQCSVDRRGTFGPVDAVLACTSHGVANNSVWRVARIGGELPFKGAVGRNSVGPTRDVLEAAGHYPWVVEHHPTDGCAMFQGFANICPTLIAVKPAGRSYAAYDHARATRGRDVIVNGGAPDAAGKVPSFTCQVNAQGASYLGLSFDHIAEMSYADAAAFFRAGGIGSVPRDIPAGVMRDLLYFVYFNSQRHIREGAALITDLLALREV